jgi:Family of unknown function (DUF5958)
MISFADSARLNRYAQGILSADEGKTWFSGKSSDEKRAVLQELAAMIQQAHPLADEVGAAIARSGLKPTHTPSVLMGRGPTVVQMAKVIALPEQEYEKAFLLFLALLGVADARRRVTECREGCSHWWHEDLADDLVFRRLVREHSTT